MAEKTDQEILYKINNVYRFIKANEATQLISNYTVQDYIDQAILQLEGPTENLRPSRKDRIKKIQEDMNYIIQRLS
jgi:hypothetical protein